MTKCLDMYYWEQVLFLLIGFIAIALFSFSRIIAYFDITGGGKVVTAFYFLIFLGSILRIIFLFSELSSGEDNTAGGFSYIDNSYRSHGNQTQINFGDQNSFHLSEPSWAFRTPRWRYVIVSEVLHSLGTLLIFSVFLLVTCHWLHMLRKIDRDASKNTTVSSTNPSSARYAVKVSRGAPTSSAASRGGPLTPVRVAGNAPGRAITPKRGAAVATPVRRTVVTPMPVRPVVPPVTTHVGPFTTFSVFMLTLLCAAGLNILLFLRGVYSSEGLMLYDNAYLSLTSVALLLALQEFSSRIRAALRTIGVMSERPTETQSRRILYITATAYLFFLTRAALELVSFGWIMHCWLRKCCLMLCLQCCDVDWAHTFFFLCLSAVSLLLQNICLLIL